MCERTYIWTLKSRIKKIIDLNLKYSYTTCSKERKIQWKRNKGLNDYLKLG